METHYKSIKASILFAALFAFSIHSFGQTLTWYQDADGDGWGNQAVSTTSANQPVGYVLNKLDCDDSRSNITTWTNVGELRFSSRPIDYANIVLDANDTPYVAFVDYSNSKITLMKYNGANWVTLATTGSASPPHYLNLAISATGVPYLVYADGAKNGKITVMKYDGNSLVAVGGTGFSAGQIYTPNITIDRFTGVPYVVYVDGANSYKAIVKKFDGTNWITVGGASCSSGSTDGTLIKIDTTGTPYVAYKDGDHNYQITVKKFEGSSWVTIGTAGFSAQANYLSMTLDLTGKPYVVYSDLTDSSKVTAMRFDGTSWVFLGAPKFSDGSAYNLAIATDILGAPYVAYKDKVNNDRVTVKKLDSTWKTIGTKGFSDGIMDYLSIAVNRAGIPYIAYNDGLSSIGGNSGKITVMKIVPQLIEAGVSISTSDVVAAGLNATFKATTTNEGTAPVYQWYKNGKAVDGATTSSFTCLLANKDVIYNRLIVNNDPCVNPKYNFSNRVFLPFNPIWYRDADSDGWGDSTSSIIAATQPVGYTQNEEDCDDSRYDSTVWNNIESKQVTSDWAFDISLTLSSNGTPYVGYSDAANNHKASVKKYNGSSWVYLGEGFTTDVAGNISMATDAIGTPYIAFSDLSVGTRATVMKYDGTHWSIVGTAGFSGMVRGDLTLIIDPYGTPYISYVDQSTIYSLITVMKYDGYKWVTVGVPGYSKLISSTAKMCIDSSGTPYVLCDGISVLKFNGSDWTYVGAKSFGPNNAGPNSIALDGSGTPYISFIDPQNNYRMTVMKFNGTSWVLVGAAGFSSLNGGAASMVIDVSGNPYLAYYEGDPNVVGKVARFDGISWKQIAALGRCGTELSMAINAEGIPYVATQDINSKRAIVYRPISTSKMSSSVNILVSDTLVIKGTSVTFTAYTIGGGSAPVYQWYKNGLAINGAILNIYRTDSLSDGDTIYCKMTGNALTCFSNATVVSNKLCIHVITDSTVGINNLYSRETRIALYPIPAREILNIQWNNKTTGSAIINVYDMTGKEVLKGDYTLTQIRETVSLPVNALAPGAYFVKATLNGQPLAPQKFIKN